MNFSVIPEERLNQIEQDLAEIKTLFKSQVLEHEASKWITKNEARKRLNVCKKTLDNYLKKGTIPFSQFGSKILICCADIETHLRKYYIKRGSSDYSEK